MFSVEIVNNVPNNSLIKMNELKNQYTLAEEQM